MCFSWENIVIFLKVLVMVTRHGVIISNEFMDLKMFS